MPLWSVTNIFLHLHLTVSRLCWDSPMCPELWKVWLERDRKSRHGSSHGAGQSQTLEMNTQAAAACLGWLGSRGFLKEEVPRQAHGRSWMICPLMTQLFGPPFYFLNFHNLGPPKTICTWNSLRLECSSPILSQNWFLFTICIPAPISHPLPGLLWASKLKDLSLPGPATLHHITQFYVLFASCYDLKLPPLFIRWRVCLSPVPIRAGILSISSPLHPCLLAQYPAHRRDSIRVCWLSPGRSERRDGAPSKPRHILQSPSPTHDCPEVPLRDTEKQSILSESKHHPDPTAEQIVFDSMQHMEAK